MKTYKESNQILEEIKSKKNILLCLHVNPDGDSIGSNLAFAAILETMQKKAAIYSVDEPQENLDFLPGFKNIIQKDPNVANFEELDLIIFLDTSEKLRATRHKHLPLPDNLSTIVIDHHSTNEGFGKLNLVDGDASSTGEILFSLFSEWNIKIDKDTTLCLLSAIASDTGTFRWATTNHTLETASKLIQLGANLNKANFNLYSRTPFEMLKYQAEVVRKMRLDESNGKKFLWAATSYEEIENMGGIKFAVGGSDLGKTVEDTDFCIVLREEEKGVMTASLRSRTDIDVSRMASLFGGGGHKAASGFIIKFEGKFENKVNEIINKIKSSI